MVEKIDDVNSMSPPRQSLDNMIVLTILGNVS